MVGTEETSRQVDGWRQIWGDADSEMMFMFHLHVAAVLSMQGLSDALTKTSPPPFAFPHMPYMAQETSNKLFTPAAVIKSIE